MSRVCGSLCTYIHATCKRHVEKELTYKYSIPVMGEEWQLDVRQRIRVQEEVQEQQRTLVGTCEEDIANRQNS